MVLVEIDSPKKCFNMYIISPFFSDAKVVEIFFSLVKTKAISSTNWKKTLCNSVKKSKVK